MSSTITQSVKRTTETAMTSPPVTASADKTNCDQLRMRKAQQAKFVRSASIEKIIKFNAYICSQHFYILPALLTWLKTGQSNLQPSVEKGLLTLKFYLFTTYLYTAIYKKFTQTKIDVNNLKANVIQSLKTPEVNRMMLVVVVYLTMIAIAFELLWCLYTLSYALLPGGLVFQCCCLYTICHINFRIMSEFVTKQQQQDEKEHKPKLLDARKILGDRTISNFNLFYSK